MWFQHLAWNHVCMISYLHCLVFKEHCFLTSFVKSSSDFCKLSVWVSFYIIPHSVPFVKNFLKYFLSLLSKQPRQAFSSKVLLCCISATTMYILQQICASVNTFLFYSHIFFEIQPAVITTFALYDLMALSEGWYPNEPVTLVAEPIHRGRNGRECHRATFATQKQESPDAKVSCPSGCCRITKAYRYCQSS